MILMTETPKKTYAVTYFEVRPITPTERDMMSTTEKPRSQQRAERSVEKLRRHLRDHAGSPEYIVEQLHVLMDRHGARIMDLALPGKGELR